MQNKKYVSLVVAAVIAAGFMVAVPVFAAQFSTGAGVNAQIRVGVAGEGGHGGMMHGAPNMAPGIFGTVTAINGNTLTVTSEMRMRMGEATTSSAMAMTYMVDATNAQVMKNGTSSTLSNIAVNDKVVVVGTVSGSNIVATMIHDGVVPMMGGHGPMGGGFGHGVSSTPPVSSIQGNGEPVVAGSVTAVSGNTITVTNSSKVTYTIDASNAKIVANGTTTTISNISVGNNIVAQGVVNGSAVTASSIIVQGNGAMNNPGGTSNTQPAGARGSGFFGAIGSFFKRIFGF